MASFDTLKLQVPASCLVGYDKHSPMLQKEFISVGGKPVGNVYTSFSDSSFGLNRAKLDISKNAFTFGFSEKILLDDYLLGGITINSIEQALTNHNKVSPFTLDINSTIENAVVLVSDSTQMIEPSYDIKLCRDALLGFCINPKFTTKLYDGWRGLGIEFNGSVSTEKRRLIMYSKYIQLQKKTKSIKDFLNNCKSPQSIINRAKGKFRVEQNHTTKKSMRNRFKVAEPTLLNMLKSKENPNKDFMRVVKNTSTFIDSFGEEFTSSKHSETLKTEGMISICKRFNLDMMLIENWLKNQFSRNGHYKWLKEYRKVNAYLLQKRRVQKNPKMKKSEKIIKHIFKLIECA